ncbi:hypothetical protein GCM10018965_073670 [Nonomuraea roseola]
MRNAEIRRGVTSRPGGIVRVSPQRKHLPHLFLRNKRTEWRDYRRHVTMQPGAGQNLGRTRAVFEQSSKGAYKMCRFVGSGQEGQTGQDTRANRPRCFDSSDNDQPAHAISPFLRSRLLSVPLL